MFRMRPRLVAVALGACAALGLLISGADAREARPPVVMIVFDEFPPDTLLGPDGQIDAVRFPHFAELSRESTWYPNATTVADWTWRAVPAIFDGRIPRKGTGSRSRGHPHTLFRLLKLHGYGFNGVEPITTLCPYRGCRRLAHRGYWANVRDGRLARLEGMIASIRPTRRPTFTFQHALLPHQPWVYLPSGRRYQAGVGDYRSTQGPPGFNDNFLVLQSEQRYLLQLGLVDREVGRLVDRLRATGLFRKALIVITADHGMAFRPGIDDRRRVTPRIIDEIAPVPLFIKAPGQRAGTVDFSYVRSIDLLPTLASLLRMRLPWRVDGRPAGAPEVKSRRSIGLVKRDYSGRVTIPTGELLRRRVADVRRRIAVFGSGPWSTLYSIGPHGDLVGKSLRRLTVGHSGHVHAELRSGPKARAGDRGESLFPAWVGGVIHGGGRGTTRDLAVAVDSRIVAVGRSFHLTLGRRPERFSIMVPEDAIRPGKDRIDVYEVQRGKLRPLAHERT